MGSSEPEVYISCAAPDRRAADVIRSAIERRGIRCAMTPEGESDLGLSVSVEAAIVCSKVFVIVYSRHSNGATALMRELEFAASRDMYMLPFRVEDALMSNELEFYLSAHHWQNAVGRRPEDALGELVLRLEALVLQPPPSTTSSSSDGAGKRLSRHKRLMHTRFTGFPLIVFVILLGGASYAAWQAYEIKGYVANRFKRSSATVEQASITSIEPSDGSELDTLRGQQTSSVAGTIESLVSTPSNGPIKLKSGVEATWSVNGTEGVLAFSNGTQIEFVWCPPGKFVRGEWEVALHGYGMTRNQEITLSRGFWLGKYEITHEQWRAITGNMLEESKLYGYEPRCPVSNLSWEDCQELIATLNGPSNAPYRLPTEAEWEYACRAGNPEDPSRAEIREQAWCLDTNVGRRNLVGERKPNAWGLFDMYGSEQEWCDDWYGPYEELPAVDPVRREPWDRRPERVLRGGCDTVDSSIIHPSNRHALRANLAAAGFRLCRDP